MKISKDQEKFYILSTIPNIQWVVLLALDKLPTVLTNNRFIEGGLVESDSGLLVPAYIGSQMGFSAPGRYFLDNEFYPKLKEAGIFPLCPFQACGEYLDAKVFDENLSVKECKELWEKFNGLVGVVNYETLMPRSLMMIAILDGSHAVDDGVSAEIAYFAQEFIGRPIVGIRSDFRLAENIAASINPAVSHFLKNEYCFLFTGPKAYDEAFEKIREIADEIINDHS